MQELYAKFDITTENIIYSFDTGPSPDLTTRYLHQTIFGQPFYVIASPGFIENGHDYSSAAVTGIALERGNVSLHGLNSGVITAATTAPNTGTYYILNSRFDSGFVDTKGRDVKATLAELNKDNTTQTVSETTIDHNVFHYKVPTSEWVAVSVPDEFHLDPTANPPVNLPPPPPHKTNLDLAPKTLSAAQELVHLPTIHDDAVLSGVVYDHMGSTPPPTGFKAIAHSIFTDPLGSGQGFEATAFKGPDGNITIAIRGTDTWNLALNLAADTGFVIPGNPLLKIYIQAASSLIAQVEANNPDAEITLTGHSLGGGIADIIAHNTGLKAVTFDAPPVGLVADQYGHAIGGVTGPGHITGDTNIFNVRLNYDPVSGLPAPQVGTTVTVANTFDPASLNVLAPHSLDNLTSKLGSASLVYGAVNGTPLPPGDLIIEPSARINQLDLFKDSHGTVDWHAAGNLVTLHHEMTGHWYL